MVEETVRDSVATDSGPNDVTGELNESGNGRIQGKSCVIDLPSFQSSNREQKSFETPPKGKISLIFGFRNIAEHYVSYQSREK